LDNVLIKLTYTVDDDEVGVGSVSLLMVLDFLLELSTEAASYEDERHLHVVLKYEYSG
jgi:hypothetical protein